MVYPLQTNIIRPSEAALTVDMTGIGDSGNTSESAPGRGGDGKSKTGGGDGWRPPAPIPTLTLIPT